MRYRLFALITIALAIIGILTLINIKISPPKSEKIVKQRQDKIENLNVPLVKDFAVPVFMYHRIDNLTDSQKKSPLMCDLTVSPADFDQQMGYLVKNGFVILSVKDVEKAIRNGTPLPKRAVAVTMDDGYRDNFEQAFPILKKYGLPATIFLVTSVISDAKHITWNQGLLMKEQNIDFGSHTVRHFDLTTLNLSDLDYELKESKKVLEQHDLGSITSLAYPSGCYNSQVMERTEAAGYLSGWKKGGGPVRPSDDAYMLPRIRIRGCTTMDDFRRKVWSGINTQNIEHAKSSSES